MRKFLREGIETLMDRLKESGSALNLQELNEQDLVLVLKHYWNENPLAMACSMFQSVNNETDLPGMYCKTDLATDACYAERHKWRGYNLHVFVEMAFATFKIYLSGEADRGRQSESNLHLRWRSKLFQIARPIREKFGIGPYNELPICRG